jgi:5-(carboxyamino)imidazole ribonucleotide mutase
MDGFGHSSIVAASSAGTSHTPVFSCLRIAAVHGVVFLSHMSSSPVIGIIMGSTSDWPTLEHAARTLEDFGVDWEAQVVSAHRTPQKLYDYAHSASSRGLRVIIAGAGGAAHLPGMCAAMTEVPVLGVPVESKTLKGVDSLLSIVQMPAGIPTATFAIGKAGAINAALFAIAQLATTDAPLAAKLKEFRSKQTAAVLGATLPPLS